MRLAVGRMQRSCPIAKAQTDAAHGTSADLHRPTAIKSGERVTSLPDEPWKGIPYYPPPRTRNVPPSHRAHVGDRMVSDGSEDVSCPGTLKSRSGVHDDGAIPRPDLSLPSRNVRCRNVHRTGDVAHRKIRCCSYVQKESGRVVDEVAGVHDDHGATPKQIANERDKAEGGHGARVRVHLVQASNTRSIK